VADRELPGADGARDGTDHDRGGVLLRVAALSVAEMRRALALPGTASDLLVRSAITYAAGPHLLEATENSGSARAREAVQRYITRMGGRATPYGLLAGTCIAKLGDRTTLRLTGRTGYRVTAYLDVALLEAIVDEHLSAVSPRLVPLRVSPTLMRVGDYFSCRKAESPLDVVRVTASPAISLALSCCESPCTAESLVTRLSGHMKTADNGKIEAFVAELMDHGLLSPDTGLLCHGRTPAEVAVGLLASTGGGGVADKLTCAASAAEHAQALTPRYLESLERSWDGLRAHSGRRREARADERYNLQLSVTCTGVLDKTIVRDLERAADRLVQVMPPPNPLGDLHARFEARYGDAAASVLEVADPERGLLPWTVRGRSAIADRVQALGEPSPRRPGTGRPDISQVQLAALDCWLSTGSPYDLAAITPPRDEGVTGGRLKATGVLAALVRDQGQAYHSVLNAAGIAGAGALFGRLAMAHPALAERMATEIEDAAPDVPGPCISAEVLYSPHGRVGNVLIRPRICGEAIALAGATGGTIHPGRLVMRLEGRGFAVFDEKTGSRVRLYVNSAYRASLTRNDPLYTLLATLAESNSGVTWQWKALRSLRHLPRVVYGRVIVTPERWLVGDEDLLACTQAPDPAQKLRSFLPGIGNRTWIGGCEAGGDRVLPVDLGNRDQIASTLRYLRKRKITELIELPHVEHPYVRGPRGYHVTEICASFSEAPGHAVTRGHDRAAVTPTLAVSRPAAREDWAYLQLFCGISSADTVITRAHALARDLRAGGLARQWFFVRYDDDGYHVRVRIRASGGRDLADVTAALHDLASALRREGLVTITRQEPYVPEVRRYGGPYALAAAESLFCADSDSVAEYLGTEPAELPRLTMATRIIAAWWRRAACPSADLYPAMRAAQRMLWPGDTWPSKGVGRVWRAYRAEVADGMRAATEPAHGEPEISTLVRRVRNQVGGQDSSGLCGKVVSQSIASVAHMHCNRLFACDNRRMEAIAYEFALREMMHVDATSR